MPRTRTAGPRGRQGVDPRQPHGSPEEVDVASAQPCPSAADGRHLRPRHRCSSVICCADSQSLPPGGGHEPGPGENARPYRDKTRADPLLIPSARRICRRAQERPADGCGTADPRRLASRRWTGTAGPSPKVCLEQPGTGQRILQTLIRAGTRRPSTGASARLQ